MCNYQILSSSRFGFIKRCDSCKKVKITFGTLSAAMYSEDLEDIKDALVEQKSELRFENHVPNTQYKLPLDKKISINMNRDELEGLYDLVLMASNMIDIYSAIEVEAEG